MSDYLLYYWPIPFRGQFVRALLEHVGADWTEAAVDDVAAIRTEAPGDQPVPHMGPPVLVDTSTGTALSQMPAILHYLGRRHGRLPEDPAREAMTVKIVADCNDVLYEMTRYNGAQMWDRESWEEYRPRLCRWMALFEETGRRHGLGAEDGHMLGTEAPGVADLASAVLWGTMTEKLPALRPLLDRTAPALAGLTDRIMALPEQAALRKHTAQAHGDAWCGGQIEASLRASL